MRISLLMFLLIWLLVGIYHFLETKYDLPQIKLPRAAQHNNLGELPIVEMADDKAFYEVDGQEDRERKVIDSAMKIESKYLACLEKVRYKCGYKNYCKIKGYDKCEIQYSKAMENKFKVVCPYTSIIKFSDDDFKNGYQKFYWNTYLKGYGLK